MVKGIKPANYLDLTGERYGLFIVMRRSGTDKHGVPVWECRCDCGKIVNVARSELRSGNTRSCGCLKSRMVTEKNTRHGMSKHRMYRIWAHIKDRTLKKTDKSYSRYGGAGIGMCERWANDFEAFYEDMKDGYRDGLSIDRIDNSKGYEPGNCRWATDKQQANNKTNNVVATLNGETKTIAEWCDIFGINSNTVYHRKKRGWSDECLFLPPSTTKYKKRILGV